MNKNCLKSFGKSLKINDSVKILVPENLSVGDHVEFKQGVYIEAYSDITIGSNTHFAPYCVLYGPLEIGKNCAFAAHTTVASVGHGHSETTIPMVEQKTTSKKVIVEDDVWVGANAVILGGVSIGKGSIIGAGSVVTKNVKPYSIMGGVPAELIRKRV